LENLCKVVMVVSNFYHEQQISKLVNYVEKLTKQQYLVCEIENYFTKDWLKLKQIHTLTKWIFANSYDKFLHIFIFKMILFSSFK
jgi:hypothetical protein